MSLMPDIIMAQATLIDRQSRIISELSELMQETLSALVQYQAVDAEPEEEPWRVQAQFWNEGYRYWWLLSNIRKLPAPIPCRGNVGMWQLPTDLQRAFDAVNDTTANVHATRRSSFLIALKDRTTSP